jgi:hypothetical protein
MLLRTYGIHGKARAGKDVFAGLLANALEDMSGSTTRVEIMSFADVLKDMLIPLIRVLCPPNMPPNLFIRECLAGELKEAPLPSIGRSPRQLMQWLGTDWGREVVDENIWTKVMDKRIDDLMLYVSEDEEAEDRTSPYVIVLIPDVRFDNEAEWLRGRVIHILRPNADEVAEHASESGIREANVCTKVWNEGTIDDLAEQAKRVALEIYHGRI